MGAKGLREISGLAPQFCCRLKTVLKNSLNFKNLKERVLIYIFLGVPGECAS